MEAGHTRPAILRLAAFPAHRPGKAAAHTHQASAAAIPSPWAWESVSPAAGYGACRQDFLERWCAAQPGTDIEGRAAKKYECGASYLFILREERRSCWRLASSAANLKAARVAGGLCSAQCPGGGETTGSGWERYSAQSSGLPDRPHSSSDELPRGDSWRGWLPCHSALQTCPCPVR